MSYNNLIEYILYYNRTFTNYLQISLDKYNILYYNSIDNKNKGGGKNVKNKIK